MNLVSSNGLLEYHFELSHSIWIFLNSLFVVRIIICLDFAPQLLHPDIKLSKPWKIEGDFFTNHFSIHDSHLNYGVLGHRLV